jgi:hypothetical protein
MRYLYLLFIVGSIIFVSCDAEKSTTPSQEKKNPVEWTTDRVSFKADHFFIVTSTDTFYANSDSIYLNSSPGDSTYCSFELEWQEHGVEMRLFIYFSADSSHWWSDEFRTYNGAQNAQWYYYYGEFFKSPLGLPFTGNFDATSDEMYNDTDTTGHVHFEGLRLEPFLNP